MNEELCLHCKEKSVQLIIYFIEDIENRTPIFLCRDCVKDFF